MVTLKNNNEQAVYIYQTHFLIEDIPQVGYILEDGYVTTYSATREGNRGIKDSFSDLSRGFIYSDSP